MKKAWVLESLVLLWLTACGKEAEPIRVRLMTHDSFDISETVLAQFESETGYKVEVFKAGDAGETVTKAILANGNPLADVLYGVDNTFLSRALENDVFVAYASPQLSEIDDALKLDPQNRALPIDFGDVCLNYDKAWFAEHNVLPPDSLEDLAEPAYANLTVVENPATSSPGLAFLLATLDHFGEEGYLDYWRQLAVNGVEVVNGWNEAYYGAFTAGGEGNRPIVVSYASSPPAAVYFAETPLSEAPIAAVTTPGSCYRQIEFVGILRGARQEKAARALVDFMLSRPFQEDIPLHMFVYPANITAALPEVFVRYSSIPQEPALLDPDLVAARRERWLAAWTDVVLHP